MVTIGTIDLQSRLSYNRLWSKRISIRMQTPVTHSFLGMPAVVRSKAMQDLLSVVERVARTNATVLITGETGSGKELVARAIHHYSLRHSKPWVDVNCAALPEHLLESELFGYEKGAFSGADSMKPGLFELANTGTLLLDEIGELDRKMQVKLLRVLDGAPYYRLGGVRKISADVRVISATNLNLEEEVGAGRFRSDLYHRLSQIHLKVPPLRERPEDVVGLAELFVRQQDSKVHFSPEAMDALRRHSWPGNVRELRNLISKSLIFANGPCIGLSDLALAVQEPAAAPIHAPVCSLERTEREMVFKALQQAKGHHQKAAQLLGISRRTLSRKLKIYGVSEVLEDSVA
jgi:DNA-binding NtrC family response regulator